MSNQAVSPTMPLGDLFAHAQISLTASTISYDVGYADNTVTLFPSTLLSKSQISITRSVGDLCAAADLNTDPPITYNVNPAAQTITLQFQARTRG